MAGSSGPFRVCLVTDRRRLPEPADRSLVELARAASAAGVDLIHLREPDLDDRHLLVLARAVVESAGGTATRIVLNDRVDVALAAGAAGVHLRGDSFAAGRVRRMAPAGFLIGKSVHSAAEASSVGDVDYVVAGTVYPSASKPEGTVTLGTAGFAAICRATPAPVLAIGGVTADKLEELAAAGAAGVAAIGLFSDAWIADGAERAAGVLRRIVADVRRAFPRDAPIDSNHA